jgi:hypothetical protein
MKTGAKNLNLISNKEIRKFGLIAFIFFGSLSALGFWNQKPVPSYIFGLLSFLGFSFILFPYRLRYIYKGWLQVAHFIGTNITILILTIAYYAMITPFSLIKRIFGGRPLPMTFDKRASSYWVKRQEPVQPKERFIKRY